MVLDFGGVVDELFDRGARADLAARSFNEPTYRFLNRSADPYIADIRQLIADWLRHVPAEHRTDLRRRLQGKNDDEFESAFWELYLHEAYRRSGYRLTIHPEITGSTQHPDFLIENDSTRFYLEAVRASAPADGVGENNRLEEAQRVLATLRADRYFIDLAVYAIGAKPLEIAHLRRDLREWLAALEQDANSSPAEASPVAVHRRSWGQEDGWRLELNAQRLRREHVGAGFPLIRSHMRMGWSHDASRILSVLEKKTKKYGSLDAPLVIAVLSNTMFHTEDIDVERALFGTLLGYRPCPQPPRPQQLLDPGYWCTSRGWRRQRVPQVIAAHSLYPWTVTKVQPRVWTMPDADIVAPAQPSWLAKMDVSGPIPAAMPADSPARLFGLPQNWSDREAKFASRPRTVPV